MKIKLNNDMELVLNNENSDGICHVSLIDSSDGVVINTCDIDEDKLFEFISSQWSYSNQKECSKNTDERENTHEIKNNLNEPDLEPFIVHVTELYSRNVIVYAENSDMAKELADELCEEGLLLLDFDNFADRNIETTRKAKEIDFTVFQVFGPEKLPESLHIPLKNRIRNAKEHVTSIAEKDIADNEPIL